MPESTRPTLPTLLSLLLLPLLLAACHTAKGATPPDKRTSIIQMKEDALKTLTESDPALAARVRSAAGYGVFSVVNTGIFIVSTGNGYGVVVNNRTREKTYLRMGELGGGIGMGVKQIRQIFLFLDEGSLESFIQHGIQLGADADATAKAKKKGIALGGMASVGSGGGGLGAGGEAGGAERVSAGKGIEVYELTNWGLSLRANLTGTKYYDYAHLN
ncbi:MAG: hypothetical protein Q8R92_13540 [Deltaproteobacteria bacterium]|nr:hypothetical protein [Deltaproteobacteria bacterium]